MSLCGWVDIGEIVLVDELTLVGCVCGWVDIGEIVCVGGHW